MTRNDIATKLAEQLREQGMTPPLATKAVNGIVEIMQEALRNKETIYFRGFATFNNVVRKAHNGYDFNSKKTIHVAERRVIRLTPSKEFINSLNSKI